MLFATDEWFAVAGNLNKEDPAVFDPNAFDAEGKLMDGWETRRKRTAGHDWCLMKLGLEGVIRGIEADTSYFTGNQVPRVSIQAANLSTPLPLPPWNAKPRKGTKASDEEVAAANACGTDKWTTIVPMSPLKPGYFDTCKHYFLVRDEERYTHIRVNYWPDGGVARLRVFGEVKKDWSAVATSALVDLAATENGGLGLMASNSHYGRPQNLLGAGRGVNMGDGWETARNPNRPPEFKVDKNGMMELPGNDWCIIQLGVPGKVEKVEIDTIHFKGNYPESCMLESCSAPKASRLTFEPEQQTWTPLLPRTRLGPNALVTFDASSGVIPSTAPITHVRFTTYPDGGVSRLRLWGKPEPRSRM